MRKGTAALSPANKEGLSECSALTGQERKISSCLNDEVGRGKTEKGSHRWLALPMATQCPLSRRCVCVFSFCFDIFSFFRMSNRIWVSHILSVYILRGFRVTENDVSASPKHSWKMSGKFVCSQLSLSPGLNVAAC